MELAQAERTDRGDEIRTGTRWLLVAFLVLTLLAVNQLFVLADVADRYWAWTIPTEMTAGFLGAAYAAGFVLSGLSLRENRWSRIRVPVVTVTVFTMVTAVATLVHAHRLHLHDGGTVARVSAWVWLAVYLVVPVAAALVVYRQESTWRRPEDVLRPIPGRLRILLALQGAVMFVAGVVLFGGGLTVHHHVESVTAFWPWKIMPLGSMAIGAWLIALGVAAAMVIGQRDLGRLFVSAVTYTVFGVFELAALIWHWPQVRAGDPWTWIYLAVLVLITGTGAVGWRAARLPLPDDAAAPSRGRDHTGVT